MFDKCCETIKKYDLLRKGDEVICALSGGADSMALLFFLRQISAAYALKIYALHVNHQIRGAEAARDEAFVRDYCRQKGIAFLLAQKDVPGMAKAQGLTLEEAGRMARKEAFASARQETGAGKIATGHHRDDQVETVLFRLMRGTGAQGMAGMAPQNGDIIRPLIECSRREIEAYCRENAIPFVNDGTNDTLLYTRNKIRHQLIPWMSENINPNVAEAIAAASGLIAEQADYMAKEAARALAQAAEKKEQEYHIAISALSRQHTAIQRLMLREALASIGGSTKDITSRHIADILALTQKGTGKRLSLPSGLVCEIQYDTLILRLAAEEPEEFYYLLPEKTRVFVPERGFYVSLSYDTPLAEDNFKNLYTKELKCDKILSNICFRTRRPGDWIQLAAGRKKLKDYFIDQKLPRRLRSVQLLLAEGSEVLMIMGMAESRRIAFGERKCYLQIWEDTNGKGRHTDTEGRARN